jgi:cell division protein FtsZ
MKNGGVAILGKAEVEGEDRAQRAIEEALASPLLNDNDIRGAKWILININSAEGENECTMDELEIINNHLRMQAGEATDVIVGMGYDSALDKKIGITLIATGFEHKDPFAKPVSIKKPEPQPEKIVMVLETEQPKPAAPPTVAEAAPVEAPVAAAPAPVPDPFAPSLQEAMPLESMLSIFDVPKAAEPVSQVFELEKELSVLQFELSPELTAEVKVPEPVAEVQVQKTEQEELIDFKVNEQPSQPVTQYPGLLSKPQNIYAEADQSPAPVRVEPVVAVKKEAPVVSEEPEMQMVMRETPLEKTPRAMQDAVGSFEDTQSLDEVEEQKKRAAERIQKLRNLSFNMNNTSEVNSEFDAVPAYVRRNMELFGSTLTSVENFYSKYTVSKDENEQTQISTINTFLDGKKPD